MDTLLNFNDGSDLETLLSDPSTTLEQVLEEETVALELKNLNNDLVNFLLRDEIFDKLVSYVCGIPPEDFNKNYPLHNENKNTKYPFVACELLSIQNEQIHKFFLGLPPTSEPASPVSQASDSKSPANAETETKVSANLIKFLDVLNSPTPIDFTVVGYFAKIFKAVFQTEGKHMGYVLFQHNPQYLKQLVQHVYSDSIMEVLIMVVKLDAPYFRSVSGDQYLAQRIELVEAIFNNIFPDESRQEDFDIAMQRQINCSNILNLLISGFSCFSNGKNIINAILTQEKIDQIMKGALNPAVIQALVPLVTQLCSHYRDVYSSKDKLPLLDLIRYTECIVKPNIPDTEPIICGVVDNLESIVETIRQEKDLASPQPIQCLNDYNTNGANTNQRKIGIVEILYNLLKLQNLKVDKKFVETNCLAVLLEMFAKNPWNNILHSNLNKVFTFVIEHGATCLKENLLEGAKILDVIVGETKDHDVVVHTKTNNKARKSYIAHMNIIANLLEKSEDSFIKNFCANNESWQEFKNGDLKNDNEKNKGLVDYPPPKAYEGKDTVNFGNAYSNSPVTKLANGFNSVYVMSPTQKEVQKEKPAIEDEDEPDMTPKNSVRYGWGDF